MTEKHTSLELTFADAIMAIAAATDLSEQTRRHWRSSLTGIAKAFDQPIELIPARYSAIRARMATLHQVPLDWMAKTLANHKSNTKAALIWFAKEKDVLPHGVPLLPAWDRLRVQLKDPSTRYRLMPLMRFCSGVHIEPAAVNEAVIDRYMDHRAHTTARASDAASRRILARLWNIGIGTIDGWPETRLIEPPVKAAEGPAWDDFPEGFRAGIEGYLTGLERIRRNKAGHRSRPCRPSTHHSTKARTCCRGQDGGEGGRPDRQPDVIERADSSRRRREDPRRLLAQGWGGSQDLYNQSQLPFRCHCACDRRS